MDNIAHLSSRSLLQIEGSEALPFLQNLITCDVESLETGGLTFGALLSPQGKILFDFFVSKTEEGFLFDVDASQRDALLKRLTFYKLRADVSLAPSDRKVIVIWPGNGSNRDPRVPELGSRLIADDMECNQSEEGWHAHRIAIGVPQSGLDFELGSAFPHDVLMDQFKDGGIDFQKGCYVGQEVVSRMQHRGTARNRLVKVTTDADSLPTLGSEIISGEKTIGTMGSSHGNSGLAQVRVDRVEKALSENLDFISDGVKLQLSKPDFANFPWPA